MANRKPRLPGSRQIPRDAVEGLLCPTCTDPLERYPIDDAFAVGLRCPADHRFYVALADARSSDMRKESVLADDPIEALREWAARPELRRHMSDQLATVLRRIWEMKHKGIHIANAPAEKTFAHCPRCGGKLSGPTADTDWGLGLACKQPHRYELRSGLNYRDTDYLMTLHEEMSDNLVIYLARRHVEDDGEWWHLHPAVKQTLLKFLKAPL